MVAFLAVGFAAGCGGGGNDDEDLTKAQFIEQGNAICEEGIKTKNAAVEESLAELSPEKRSDPETLEELLVEVALPPVQEMAEEVGDLNAPQGQERKVSAIVETLETELDRAEANPASALNESEKLFRDSNRLAAEYGLEACAQV